MGRELDRYTLGGTLSFLFWCAHTFLIFSSTIDVWFIIGAQNNSDNVIVLEYFMSYEEKIPKYEEQKFGTSQGIALLIFHTFSFEFSDSVI